MPYFAIRQFLDLHMLQHDYFICVFLYSDCADLMNSFGGDVSGPHEITPINGGQAVDVLCDSEGWTVIQSRGNYSNPANYFLQEWTLYEEGFGLAGKYTISKLELPKCVVHHDLIPNRLRVLDGTSKHSPHDPTKKLQPPSPTNRCGGY
jgi:hypothetical protein